MFGVSLGTLVVLMIVTGEVYMVDLSMGLQLGSPLDSTNPVINGIILDMSLVNTLGLSVCGHCMADLATFQ